MDAFRHDHDQHSGRDGGAGQKTAPFLARGGAAHRRREEHG